MSDLSDAFDELLDVNAEALGESQFVIINGKKHDAIIEEIGSSEFPIAGGESESEQFRVKVRKREFSSMPEKGDPCKVRGRKLEIVGPVVDRNGVEYEITIGDLTAGER